MILRNLISNVFVRCHCKWPYQTCQAQPSSKLHVAQLEWRLFNPMNHICCTWLSVRSSEGTCHRLSLRVIFCHGCCSWGLLEYGYRPNSSCSSRASLAAQRTWESFVHLRPHWHFFQLRSIEKDHGTLLTTQFDPMNIHAAIEVHTPESEASAHNEQLAGHVLYSPASCF